MTDSYTPLPGGDFQESFLMDVASRDWPNEITFSVWSSKDQLLYRITAFCVLEFHFVRVGTGYLGEEGEGIPLDDVYQTHEEEYEFWRQRIDAFRQTGYDDGEDPICIVFNSPLFANRQRQIMTRDRNMGIFVACRSYEVNEDLGYDGPRPEAYRIPSSDN